MAGKTSADRRGWQVGKAGNVEALGRRTLLEFGDNGSAGNLVGVSELRQKARGVVEACEASQMFQLLAVSRRGQHAELRATGFQSMRGFGEGTCVVGLHGGANLLHQRSGIVQIRGEDLRQKIGASRSLK